MGNLTVVVIKGLGDRAGKRLQSFLFEIADDLCDVTAADELADAAIVDTDGGFDLPAYRKAHPRLPVMVLAQTRPNDRGVIWIPKPIMEAALIEALNWVRIALKNVESPTTRGLVEIKVSGDAPRVDAPRVAEKPATKEVRFQFFNAENSLLAVLQKARQQAEQQQLPVRCQVGNSGYLVILPSRNEIFASVPNNRILGWCEQEDIGRDLVVDVLDEISARQIIAAADRPGAQQPLLPFLWRLGIWTGRGRLPAGLDLNQRYYLRGWPNLTRFLEIPHAFAIAALWVREPMTLAFVVETLRINAADMANFYLAASAVGLAGPALREVDYLLANRAGEEQQNSRVIHVMRNIGRHVASPG